MKKFFLFCLVCAAHFAQAQYVSLQPGEIDRLRALLASDTLARRQYEPLKAAAAAAFEQAPGPIDTIHTEGRLQGDPQKAASWKAFKDLEKMLGLALQYRLTHEVKYRDKAMEYLLAWATVNKPNGDPIDDTNLDPAVEAFDLLKDDLPAAQKAVIVAWLEATAQEEIRKATLHHGLNHNNWHSHRIKEVGEIGFATGNKTLQQYAISGMEDQVEHNLLPDGSGIDFAERDALHYQLYNLEPLIKLAVIIRRATGKDYYNYVGQNKASIAHCVAWTVPFITGAQKHAEFVNSKVEFDRKRAANKEGAYKIGGDFNPQAGIYMLTLAEYFQPSLHAVTSTLKPEIDNGVGFVNVLNQVRRASL
ncbi:MAG TPA: alginate lyase family protein [Chitinophaga sp.]